MGTKLTGTLVAANLVAVSGLAGLQLYGAIQSMDAEAATPRITFLRNADPSAMTASTLYPAHPVRVMSRNSKDDVGTPVLVTLAGPGTDPNLAPTPIEGQPSPESQAIIGARAPDGQEDAPTVTKADAQTASQPDTMAEAAEVLGRINTAAGPAHAMSSPLRVDRGSPQEAWEAAPRRQVAYRARLIEASPGTATDTESVTPKTATSGSMPKPKAAKSAATGSARETADPLMARRMKPDAPGAAGYVIVASYGTRESAAVEAARFGHWQPSIMPAKVKGKDYFRVAIGPFARTDLQPALKAVIGDGAAKAWPLMIKPAATSAQAQ